MIFDALSDAAYRVSLHDPGAELEGCSNPHGPALRRQVPARRRLTYVHYVCTKPRPVPSLTLAGYGLPPTETVLFRSLINIEHLSRLKPQTFITGYVCPHDTETLPTEIRDRLLQLFWNIYFFLFTYLTTPCFPSRVICGN